jgi:hypothetical protein
MEFFYIISPYAPHRTSDHGRSSSQLALNCRFHDMRIVGNS